MKTALRHVLFCLLPGWMLTGCGSYSDVRMVVPRFEPISGTSGPATQVEKSITSAGRLLQRQPLAALAGYLDAARASAMILRGNPEDRVARRDYNFAVARILTSMREAGIEPWSSPVRVPSQSGDFVVAVKKDKRPNWNPALYNFTPADQFDLGGSYVVERTTRDGLGAPVVAVGKEDNRLAKENFGMQRIYYGVTAVARFSGSRCELSFEDPLTTESIRFEDHQHPLAADFTAPLAVMLAAHDPKSLEIMRVFRPADYAETAKIVCLQPYDPNKTVVLAIHGLMDSQATWTPMINALRGDPEIRKHYQFWFYSYPSGYPYPYSASILRHDLDAIGKRYPLRKPMVLVGHSMGGCISRLMVTDSGEQVWNQLFRKPPAEVRMSPRNRAIYEDALIFKRRPEVGRVIFIASPLRGSQMAGDWIGRLISRLVKGPSTLMQAGQEAAGLLNSQAGDLVVRDVPNSVDTLSPNNRFVRAINAIPISPGIPCHTIIGDRGKGDSPNSSDGVVPYWSSHLDSATSELVVPSGHSAHQNPEAIREVSRILKSHLR